MGSLVDGGASLTLRHIRKIDMRNNGLRNCGLREKGLVRKVW